jgi:hypothetical protein
MSFPPFPSWIPPPHLCHVPCHVVRTDWIAILIVDTSPLGITILQCPGAKRGSILFNQIQPADDEDIFLFFFLTLKRISEGGYVYPCSQQLRSDAVSFFSMEHCILNNHPGAQPQISRPGPLKPAQGRSKTAPSMHYEQQ